MVHTSLAQIRNGCWAPVDARIKPLRHFILSGSVGSKQMLRLAGKQVGTVIVVAVEIIVLATRDRERLAAMHGCRRSDRPAVQ